MYEMHKDAGAYGKRYDRSAKHCLRIGTIAKLYATYILKTLLACVSTILFLVIERDYEKHEKYHSMLTKPSFTVVSYLNISDVLHSLLHLQSHMPFYLFL